MKRWRWLALAILVGLAHSSTASPSLVEQGHGAMVRGQPDSAIAILERAVERAPGNAEAHFQLALAHGSKAQESGLVGKVRHARRGMRELETAIALDPRHIEARMMLLEARLAAPGLLGGSTERALAQAKAIMAIDPIVGHRAYATVYTHQKKGELARKEYLDAIQEHPESARAHTYFGLYLVNAEKDYVDGFSEFNTALELDPEYMPAYYHLGRTAALADSNLHLGEQSLRRYLEYTPKDNEPEPAWAHYRLGQLYEHSGLAAEAKQSYRAAIALNPGLKDAARALKRLNR